MGRKKLNVRTIEILDGDPKMGYKYLAEGVKYNSLQDIKDFYKLEKARLIRVSSKPKKVKTNKIRKTKNLSKQDILNQHFMLGHKVKIMGIEHECVEDDHNQLRYIPISGVNSSVHSSQKEMLEVVDL